MAFDFENIIDDEVILRFDYLTLSLKCDANNINFKNDIDAFKKDFCAYIKNNITCEFSELNENSRTYYIIDIICDNIAELNKLILDKLAFIDATQYNKLIPLYNIRNITIDFHHNKGFILEVDLVKLFNFRPTAIYSVKNLHTDKCHIANIPPNNNMEFINSNINELICHKSQLGLKHVRCISPDKLIMHNSVINHINSAD